MSLYVQNRRDELVPDGEYTAKIQSIKLSKDGQNVIFRCELTTAGFENTVIPGFCGAHWKPSTRTTQNLRQWCINLGANVVNGQEDNVDIEGLQGKECRVIIQTYTSKMGEQKCKVSNILPFERVVHSAPVKKGLFISNNQNNKPAQAAQQAPVYTPVPKVAPSQASEVHTVEAAAPASIPQPAAAAPSESNDDLW